MSSEVPIPEEALIAYLAACKQAHHDGHTGTAYTFGLAAAAPLILAADLDAQAEALDQQASALGSPRHDTSASGMVVILRDLSDDMRGRASVLRGEGQT